MNTVVHRFNKYEANDFANILGNFIKSGRKIDRWKIFQTLRVEGQNDLQFENIKADTIEFNSFIYKADSVLTGRDISTDFMVPENNEAMTGSYLLVDQGRLFENSQGKHTYSDSLIKQSMEHCIKQINLDRDMFIKRGGIYNWK